MAIKVTGEDLVDLMHRANRRTCVVGSIENGVIIGLDLEGRFFCVLHDQVLNKVVPSAILNYTNKTKFLNPGGDVLWPAPEGTRFGYQYSTGEWRVPPAITGAVWEVVAREENKTVLRAEIDLVNNRQIGIPCEFERRINIECNASSLVQNVTEVIRYIGDRTLYNGEYLLAPWSLCQFDSGTNGMVVMPPPQSSDIWDLYDSSASKRKMIGDLYTVETATDRPFQIGLGANIPWIEYVWQNQFRVRRYSGKLPNGQNHIDISDADPEQLPSELGVNLSVYCDPSGFMEIEACGGCPESLETGTELCVSIVTEYLLETNF